MKRQHFIVRTSSRLATLLLAAAALLIHPRQARAQDPFEIEVYGHQTETRGEWDLETHVNFVARGSRLPDGFVAPGQHQAHVAFELTGGLTDHWEVTAYALTAYRPDAGLEYAGWRLRSRVGAPERWGLPVDLGFAAELEFTRPAWDENAASLELRPIIEKRLGRVALTFNPVLERGLAGQLGRPAGEWEMEPSARVAFRVGPVLDLGMEYFGKAALPGGALPADERIAQFYPGMDLKLGDDLELNLGVGIGATGNGSQLVFKGRFGIPVIERGVR